MSQTSVDDCLERFVHLFNTTILEDAGRKARLTYTQTVMPVTGAGLCECLYTRNDLAYDTLEPHLRWANNDKVSKGDAMFFFSFLRRTFIWAIWPRVWGADIAVPGSLHVADAEHIPQPGAAGAWRCAVAVQCLASLSSLFRSHTRARVPPCHVIPTRSRLFCAIILLPPPCATPAQGMACCIMSLLRSSASSLMLPLFVVRVVSLTSTFVAIYWFYYAYHAATCTNVLSCTVSLAMSLLV